MYDPYTSIYNAWLRDHSLKMGNQDSWPSFISSSPQGMSLEDIVKILVNSSLKFNRRFINYKRTQYNSFKKPNHFNMKPNRHNCKMKQGPVSQTLATKSHMFTQDFWRNLVRRVELVLMLYLCWLDAMWFNL